MESKGRLILFCGKMGAGKTTLSTSVAADSNAVLVSEDEWLSAHYPGKIHSFEDYLIFSKQIKPFVKKHIQRILAAGTTIVMDFPANTIKQRQWLLSLCNEIGADHQLIYINVSDDLCLSHISKRREQQPERAQFDRPEVFYEVTKYFEAPSENEGLNIVERTSI